MNTFGPHTLVRETGPLTEDYLPSSLPGRESQYKEVGEYIVSMFKKAKLPNIWLHGPPGTGKTTVIRKALGQMEVQGIRTAYVNCWSSRTFCSVLEDIFVELRALVGDRREASFKFDRLLRIAREKPLIVVLDEVDQMYLKDRNTALYNFSRLDHSGLICLGQTRQSFFALDQRVISRVNPLFIEFSPYEVEILVEILKIRASESLEPESWCIKDLDIIARASQGDARIAVQALRTAAYLAEKSGSPQIRPDDIAEGVQKCQGLKRKYALNALSEHHRLLYLLVKTAGSINSRDLWKKYLEQAHARKLSPMARRTYNYYKKYLITQRFLEETQGRGRRNSRLLKVVEC